MSSSSLLPPSPSPPAWFDTRYPPHYVAQRLSANSSIVVDGALDDAAWHSVPWTTAPLVDITHHANASLNAVPDELQLRAKMRWDARYLYVGVEVREQLIWANVTGHNSDDGPPYKDNDVELFVDPSGTTQFYKEFELSARNATYDVLWGVPDSDGLRCDRNGSLPYLPRCVNTSSRFYPGTWTMANTRGAAGLGGGGLTTATAYAASDYGAYRHPYTTWTAELAFPLRAAADGSHGGLLDTDDAATTAAYVARYDPSAAAQVYWHFDLSRAQHFRRYRGGEFCPFDCAAGLAAPSLAAPSSAECAAVKARWPTLLGTQGYNCYWEWAIASPSTEADGFAYMHRPLRFATLQFAPSGAAERCRNVEFPGRHLSASILQAQRAALAATGAYAADISAVADACAPPQCDADALRDARARPELFSFAVHVVASASVLSAGCTARPCFNATVTLRLPGDIVAATINENSWLRVEHSAKAGERPCL